MLRILYRSMWELPGEAPKPILRGHNTAAAFDQAIMFLDKAVKKKIRYYKVHAAFDVRRRFVF